MLRAIYKDKYSKELVVRGDISEANLIVSEYEGICIDLHYGYKANDYVRVQVGDKIKAEGILRGATVSGLLDFMI